MEQEQEQSEAQSQSFWQKQQWQEKPFNNAKNKNKKILPEK